MWNDIETTTDYLHFSAISNTIAELIIESGNNPISIGVSGSWGTGKSSMIKMIGRDLEEKDSEEVRHYIFIEFNAWLYQGYEDAKSALLQAVSQKLANVMEAHNIEKEDKPFWNKFISFTKRVNWLKAAKISIPLLAGLMPGFASFGAIADVISTLKNSKDSNSIKENTDKLSDTWENLVTSFDGILKEAPTESATQQIDKLRKEFEEILEKLDVKLVVLVDDLDRCLPETAISTLEAMRLLLFVERTAFIIAADEQMIRNGVRAHFGNVDLSDDLVTSYFDKLIQVPIKVPRLGIAEIKIYMTQLFFESIAREKKILENTQKKIQNNLADLLTKAWEKEITADSLATVFQQEKIEGMEVYISIADQLAGILATAENIKGNPRLIKRFLNALEIRKKVAELNGITSDPKILVKMLLFERCGSVGAFDYLSKIVAESKNGKPEIIQKIESELKDEKQYIAPDATWDSEFMKSWLLLEPQLSEHDLRPLLYLSRDKAITFAAYDELSAEGKLLFDALKKIDSVDIIKDLVEKLKKIGEREAEQLFNRIASISRNNQWEIGSLGAELQIIEAFPALGPKLAMVLAEIPANARTAPIASAIGEKKWAKDLLQNWLNDADTPRPTKTIIKRKQGD